MKYKVLIIGAGGMLGSAMFRLFSTDSRFTTLGTLRSPSKKAYFTAEEQEHMVYNVDVANDSDLLSVFSMFCPDIVINCVGIIKQAEALRNRVATLTLNAVLPHRLVQYCQLVGARLVHVSTDCVFSGLKGNYTEEDFPDATDLYGLSKYLGEVDQSIAVTLRTSIIGHELETNNSLIDWFLSQAGPVSGYTKAVFSGLPSIEIARVIRDFVIPNEKLSGIYHLSAAPIDKFSLLKLVNEIYGRETEIVPDDRVVINRSLNSDRFRSQTGFRPESWQNLILLMHEEYVRLQTIAGA